MPAHTVMSSRTDSRIFAGDGDLAYFSAAAHRALVPDMAGMQNKPDPDQPFEDGLTHNINRMRGRLDQDFLDSDLYQASLDAAEISRMCYASFCMQHGCHRAVQFVGGGCGFGVQCQFFPHGRKFGIGQLGPFLKQFDQLVLALDRDLVQGGFFGQALDLVQP